MGRFFVESEEMTVFFVPVLLRAVLEEAGASFVATLTSLAENSAVCLIGEGLDLTEMSAVLGCEVP